MMDSAESRACIATGDMLSRLVEIFRGLKLDPARMRANLDLGGGLIMAEAVMLDLGQTTGRQHAHDVVYDVAMEAATAHKSFGDLLAADPRVTAHMSPAQVKKLLEPTAYTGLSAQIARDAATRARETAKGIRAG
jgi:adenylosuccinate lyase